MRVTQAELRKLFHLGESIATAGGRSTFELIDIKEDCVRIKPPKGRSTFRLAYDKLNALLARARSIEKQIAQEGRVERAVGLALNAADLSEAQREVYLWGFVRQIVERRSKTPPVALTDLEAKFVASVERAVKDSTAQRRQRLQGAAKVPSKVKATTYVFIRNPDVVAEVLSRAAGVCEGCRKAAPFLRKKDGTPSLEVHHKVQLINGGKDTIHNAVALCPNCHRRRHFGCA